ncbi:hypothetical protein WN51_09903 [Melipona quadrifasciata]|uniref:Uncharacterized protein n=1 Tax=Melipona quadrifasciata TaxID=166423 RepID=A0A0M9AA62_9HYME|nr:hypothetical protein WN51_09903 [Melipona quadrifasciata]
MEDFIPTRVSKIKKDGVKRFVLINYEKPKKKIEIVSKSEENNDAQNLRFNVTKNECSKNDDTEKRKLDMKRVRYEVMKFGMSGFKGAEAEEAEIALAISLGAKPSKKKGINYKILQHKKKNHKETWQEDITASSFGRSLLNDKHKKTQVQFNKNKGFDSLLKIYGKVNKKNIG